MADSRLAECITALGGAKGIILILTTIASLFFGGFKWDSAVKAEQKTRNVIEGQEIILKQQIPAIVAAKHNPPVSCGSCDQLMRSHIREFH